MPADPLSLIAARLGSEASSTRLDELLVALCEVRDPRRARGVRHRFATILAVSVCAVLAGAKSFVAIGEWACDLPLGVRLRLGLGRRAPSETTIRRGLQRLDPAELDAVLARWLGRVPAQDPTNAEQVWQVVAVDGKTARGARGPGGQVHLLAAFDTTTGATLGQVQVDGKTNEITAFPLLVKGIDVAGALVTADAMHTQREHVTALREAGAHWLFTVKGNQPKLRKALTALPWKEVPVADKTVEADHGRIEIRALQVVEVRAGIAFPGAALALRMRRTRKLPGKTPTTETILAITDLRWHQIQPWQLAEAMRAHWGIENRVHWVRDVTFGEDHSQVRTGNGPAAMAGLRNFAIGLHRRRGETNIAKGTRTVARHPLRALALIG